MGDELFESGTDTRVDDGVADLRDQAAHDRRVDDDLHLDLLPDGLAERRRQPANLIVGERVADRTSAKAFCLAAAARSTSRSMMAGRSWARPAPTTSDTSAVVVGEARPPRRSSTMACRFAAGII